MPNSSFNSVKLALDYFKYRWKARQLHGTHSPFVYHFVENVLLDEREFYAFKEIELFREKLISSKDKLHVQDFGAGSKVHNGSSRSVSKMVRTGSIKPKFGRLLFRMVNEFKPNTILELGTQLGMGTLYLAKGRSGARFITLEGSPEVADRARQNLSQMKVTNVEVRTGPFQETLQPAIDDLGKVEFTYIDGNHTSEATIDNYKKLKSKAAPDGILVFDDIRWSADMQSAWEEICADPDVILSIDLFFIGIVFLGLNMERQSHVLGY